jgi:hypothetical protein
MVMGLVSRNIPFTEVYLAVLAIGFCGLLGSRIILTLKTN